MLDHEVSLTAPTPVSLFIGTKMAKIVIALVYIDNGIFLGHDQQLVDKKKHAFLEHWECCNTGDVKEFLGMQVHKTAHHVEIDQINLVI